jgi:hypothetical protein
LHLNRGSNGGNPLVEVIFEAMVFKGLVVSDAPRHVHPKKYVFLTFSAVCQIVGLSLAPNAVPSEPLVQRLRDVATLIRTNVL